jgi:hypothetical protein
MRVVCLIRLVGIRVVVRHRQEDDGRVRKRVEVHQYSVVVIVDDESLMMTARDVVNR